MSRNFTLSASPHVRSRNTTTKTMGTVLIALIPALIASILFFGTQAMLIVLVSVVSCVGFEFLWNLILRKKQTVSDLSAVITGVLLAFNMPATIPLYLVVLASAFSILVVKMMFGGLGKNIFNPALAGRVFLFFLFRAQMSNFTNPVSGMNVDITASATPIIARDTGLLQLFLGNVGGSIGETSKFALLIGFAILLITKTVKPHVPVSFIAMVALASFAIGRDPLYAILTGGVFLGAIFMATDYTTTTTNEIGGILYGLGAGLLTVLVRRFLYPEGVSIALLLMNVIVIGIRRITIPVQFGGKNKYKTEKSLRILSFAVIAIVVVSLGGTTLLEALKQPALVEPAAIIDVLGEEYESISVNEEIVKEVHVAGDKKAVVVSKDGYSADTPLVLLVVIGADNTVESVIEITNEDTAGLGKDVGAQGFYEALSGATDTSNVDVLAGVTVTSGAVLEMVQAALDYVASM